MPYYPATDQLVEEVQAYLETDPRFFLHDWGAFCWWDRMVLFERTEEEITLRWDGESITFPRP